MLFRLSAVLLATCLAIPVALSSASAESQISNKKRFNFNSGSSTRSNDGFWSQLQRKSKRVRRARSFDFFNNNRGFFTNRWDERDFDAEVRQRNIRRVRQRVRLSDNDGPDAASTGEEYYTYAADKPVALVDSKLEQPKPPAPVFASGAGATVNASDFLDTVKLTDPVAQALFEAVKDGTAGVSLEKKQVTALITAYSKRAFEPVWLEDGKPSAKARKVLETLSKADQEGLDPAHYEVQIIKSAGGIDNMADDPATLARFDLQLSAMALRYSDHASGGLVTPNKISGYHDLTPPQVAAKDAVASLLSHPAPADWLMALHPKLPAYAAMKAELIRLGTGEKEPEQIVVPTGPMLRLGSQDDRVPILRERLKQLKFIKNKDELALAETRASDAPLFGSEAAILAAETQSSTLNEADIAALKAFQKSAALRADGIVGKRTIDALNGKKRTIKREVQLALNMERLRWLPRNLGDRYVLVNQPAYEMKIINKGATEWSTRVIVGKPRNQTYFFSDEMERVEFNPYWGVPQSIIKGEYLRKLQSNPGYLDQRGYETVRNGRVVSSSSVDWWNYSGGIGVRQKPGPRNALGEVKFMFPNKHAIYLHDTPKRSLFKNKARAYSHGCVRVQNPRDLATHILGWPDTKVAATIAAGQNKPVQLSKKLPVHLTYFTAWIDETENLTYYSDVYNRDKYLANAFKAEQTVLQ
jgi:murein L,D-transpeptidase YcbB/YkuD